MPLAGKYYSTFVHVYFDLEVTSFGERDNWKHIASCMHIVYNNIHLRKKSSNRSVFVSMLRFCRRRVLLENYLQKLLAIYEVATNENFLQFLGVRTD